MAKKYDDEKGVWRTIGGKHIFIRNGQDLDDAMRESGKFKGIRVKNKAKEYAKKKKEKDELRRKEEEYKLYKRAKDHPDSIDAMTENSTDWERLDKEYSKRYQQEKLMEKIDESAKKMPTTNFVDDDDRYDKDTGKKLDVSINKYIDKDGNFDPKREKLHQEIIHSYFEGKTPVPEGEEKLYYMTGGGAGTGKSTFVNNTGEYYGKDFESYVADAKNDITLFKGNMIKLDADDLKKRLGLDPKDEGSAGYLHGESSALVKRITAIAQENGYNIMLDGTGDGGLGEEDNGKWTGMLGKVKSAKDKGYKVIANYGTVSVEEGLERNWTRYISMIEGGISPRLVSGDEVVKTHAKVSQILPELSKEFDSIKLYDMSDKPPRLIAEGGSGKSIDENINPSYNKEYLAFLEKAKYNWDDYADFYDERIKKFKKERGEK